MTYMMRDGLERGCIDDGVYKGRVKASFWFFFPRLFLQRKKQDKRIHTVGIENTDSRHSIFEAAYPCDPSM
jgi:hypothetical protein